MFNIILLGPPASGKGTQTKLLIQKYGFVPIALGALLRQKMAENGPDKAFIEEYINNGQLIPDSLSLKLVAQLVQAEGLNQSLLFDGFPRTISQATFLDNLLTQYNGTIDGVIFLDVPQEILLQRLKNRAAIEVRSDDQDDSKIKTRMDIYEEETLPIVHYYQAQHKLYSVNGIDPVDQVAKAIETIMDGLRT